MPNGRHKVKEEKISQDGHDEKAALELVQLLFNTPEDKLPELTNIPLNQVLPLSMMAAVEQGIKAIADKLDGKNEPPKLLSEIWRKSYAQYRRSIRGEHKMALATLTQEEMALKEEEGEEPEEL